MGTNIITPQELRIGNFILFAPNKKISRYCKVLAVSEGQIVGLDKRVPLASDFEPIPLTPEILKKYGFKKHEFGDGYIKDKIYYVLQMRVGI